MRWSTYRDVDGAERVGVHHEGRLHPTPEGTTLLGLLGDDGTRLRAAGEQALRGPGVAADGVRPAPPVPRPPSVRDFMAFEEHVVTASAAIGLTVDPLWYSQPVFYFTNPASLHGAHDDVAVSPGSVAFDYELEVAVVVGVEGADLAPDEALDHIAGFVLFCDWSARDLQGAEMALNLGPAKGKDSASSLGPWLVTPDELAGDRGAPDVALSASVDGRVCSSGNLADLYWGFGAMIAYASRGTRVVPGDVIASGTVGTGCLLELSRVHGADAYPYLSPGSTVRLDGGVLGAVEARIVAGVPAVPVAPRAAGRPSPPAQEAP